MSRFKRFYWPWSFDARLRAYPIGGLLNPHSPSYERAAIKFDQGVRIKTQEQLDDIYRTIGTAALGGRKSYVERICWARDNAPYLVELLNYHQETTIQRFDNEGFDDPWYLLSLISEFRSAVMGDDLWRVPLFADQCQSGLAFLSGSLRDPVGLTATNCLNASDPSKKPADAYLKVAAMAKQIAEGLIGVVCHKQPNGRWQIDNAKPLLELGLARKFIKDTSQLANDWLRRIARVMDPQTSSVARKCAKSPVMTACYGSSTGSRHKSVGTTLTDKRLPLTADDYKHSQAKEENSARYGLVNLLQRASEISFPRAFAALRWIKRYAEKATQLPAVQKNGLTWNLDDGSVINICIGTSIQMRPSTLEFGRPLISFGYEDEQNTSKLKGSAAPNIIHSFDSLTLRRAIHNWETPVLVIHDCVATLPGDLEKMKDLLKDGFIDTCRLNPLHQIATDWGVEDVEALEYGSADLNKVMDSVFMYQ